MSISDEEPFWFCHLLWSFIRTETPNGLRPRQLECLREHLRAVLLVVGDNRATSWITTLWKGITVVLTSHRSGLDMQSLRRVLATTDISESSMGGRRGSWSFWTLSFVEYRGRVIAECRKTLVALSRHLPPEDAEGVGDLLGELDTFLGNVALGLRASGGA